MFILEITHSGFKIKSTGCPFSSKGISSTGTILETIHLFPCLPAILSPTSNFFVSAIKTFTCLKTQVGRLSHSSLFNISTFKTFHS